MMETWMDKRKKLGFNKNIEPEEKSEACYTETKHVLYLKNFGLQKDRAKRRIAYT